MDAATTTLPYSTANTKGQCIRHLTIQLKQKKTFGSGYKTITSICPMCAMELMSIEGNDQDDDCGRGQVGHVVSSSSTSVTGWDASSIHASAQRSNSSRSTHRQQQQHRSSRSRRHSKQRSDDVSIKSAPSTYNREPRNNNIESTSSFGQSSRSCGSHHRPTTNINKQYYSHEISSCDSSTLDMSLSVSSRSSRSSSSSQGGGSSHRNISSSSSSASYTSSHSGQSHRSNNTSHHPPQQQEQYVCGLQYNNGYYTGKIDIGTQLPHGLGSLRDRQGAICNEGQWHYGRLVESTLPSSRGSTNTSLYDPRQQDEKKTNNFEQYIVSSSEEDDSASSACSTVHTDDNDDSSIPSVALSSQSSSSSSSWTSSSRHSSSSSSTTRRLYSPSSPKYSARESKNTTLSLVPQDKFKSSSRISSQATRTSVATTRSPQAAAGKQVSHNKLQEYQNYIDMCDDNEDWYLENQERPGSRRVRFREDP